MDAIAQGWTMGRRARMLFGEKFEEHWSRDIEEYLRELQVKVYTPI
jgi:ubiquinone biosynthesis protein Coq4